MRQMFIRDILVDVDCIHHLQGEDCAGCGWQPTFEQIEEKLIEAIEELPFVKEVKAHF